MTSRSSGAHPEYRGCTWRRDAAFAGVASVGAKRHRRHFYPEELLESLSSQLELSELLAVALSLLAPELPEHEPLPLLLREELLLPLLLLPLSLLRLMPLPLLLSLATLLLRLLSAAAVARARSRARATAARGMPRGCASFGKVRALLRGSVCSAGATGTALVPAALFAVRADLNTPPPSSLTRFGGIPGPKRPESE